MKKVFVCLFIFLFAGTASASIINLYALDKGTYDSTGFHDAGSTAHRIGQEMNGTRSYNSFFNFDVSSLAGMNINSVELIFKADNTTFWTSNTSEIVEIWDVTSDPIPGDHSTPSGSQEGQNIYNDLMSGSSYGQVVVDTSDKTRAFKGWMPEVSLLLDPASFADILNGDTFSLGAHVSTLESNWRAQFLWEASGTAPVQLRIDYTVPEPATMFLFGTGLISIAGFRLRRKKKQ